MTHHSYTPVSLYRGGLDFLEGAATIASAKTPLPLAPFAALASHSLELVLKSYLVAKGLSEDQLKAIGHNLERAWNRCRSNGLNLDSIVPRWVLIMNSGHEKPFHFRYARENTGIVVPNAEQLIVELRAVFSIVGAELGLNSDGNAV